MAWISQFAKSSVGAKVLMALTGVILCGFVLVHMLGNLQVFLGPDAYNAYAAKIQSMPELVWAVRIILLTSVVVHIYSGLRLAAFNKAARPVPYAQKTWIKASLASRTMALSGLTLLAFIIYHLLHFTVGITDPQNYHLTDALGRHDVYSMFVFGFQNIYVSFSYIVAMLLLGAHLSHGATSLFQSLGLNHPRYNNVITKIGPVFGTLIALGNISMPVCVMLGVIQPYTLTMGG